MGDWQRGWTRTAAAKREQEANGPVGRGSGWLKLREESEPENRERESGEVVFGLTRVAGGPLRFH